MTTLVFDIETNGLLDELDRLHCLCIKDLDNNLVHSLTPGSIEVGVKMLEQADILIGHNILKFDIPAIQKVYPWFKLKEGVVLHDTLIMARLIYPEIANMDYGLANSGQMPKKLIGRYSLESFGYRIGEYKGDYKGGWETWNQEMQDYCEQDIEVTAKLYAKIMERKERHQVSDYSVELEHRVAEIIFRQEMNGFGFDMPKAEVLHQELLVRRMELEKQLLTMFPPWEVRTPFIPKVNNKTRGYVKGEMTYKVQVVEFNPSSRMHIAKVLKEKHGWQPKEFTEKGEAKVDDSVLAELDYPEAKLLAEYFLIQKRLGQLAEGGEGLMKRVKKDGRIHGEVITNGAVTGRMTHRKPNMAQIPANRSPYGERFRELFVPRKGWKLVGCDADALELRCLAHYMSAYDEGAYIDVVLKGKKADGTDMHSVNCRAIGFNPATHRDIAKTFFYAFIYGAGDFKIGTIVNAPKNHKNVGARIRRNFLKNLPALGMLTERVGKKVKDSGALRGIDGRRLSCRSEHSALNTLLQSAGAVAMKVALVVLDDDLKSLGYTPKTDYEFVGNIHDELQIECRPEIAETVGQTAADAIRKAGEKLGFRCELAGNYEVGENWKQTH
ncbi:PolA DNA polymerase I - 3'-5' exonuclease and polymerase domains [uncultured Caudovirales phage]|uniref:DNA-directed DNA polymerase n=1 Tax=uncultured Caudovirales phage TaxID=2100421 RepID=A0A6J7WDF2_9CAUD|nr:PolA DNA polymerase I - 3'-5' exonuclease and polymerase domains [uncultured Caudovirales phage]